MGFGTLSIFSHLPWPFLSRDTRAPALPPPPFLPPLSLLPPLHYRLPSAELLMAPDYPGVWEMTTTATPPPGSPPPPGTSQPTTNLYPRLMLGVGGPGRWAGKKLRMRRQKWEEGDCFAVLLSLCLGSPGCLGLGRAMQLRGSRTWGGFSDSLSFTLQGRQKPLCVQALTSSSSSYSTPLGPFKKEKKIP